MKENGLKRDLDLIRLMLLHIESSHRTCFTTNDFKPYCNNENILNFNIHLMYEAGVKAGL